MNTAYLKAVAERAVKTFAQTELALLTAGSSVVNVIHIEWQDSLGISGGAALISVLTSIASGFGPGEGPSAVGAEVLPPKPVEVPAQVVSTGTERGDAEAARVPPAG